MNAFRGFLYAAPFGIACYAGVIGAWLILA